MKERFEWIHSWCDYADKSDLPRVLLIGDSITLGYQEKVRQKLKGVCYVDFISTSYAIDTKIYNTLISGFATDSDYSLIHFNHGLHGQHISKRTYKSKMKKLLLKIAADAKIVPDVSIVGKAKLSVSRIASFTGIVFFVSIYLFEMTIA